MSPSKIKAFKEWLSRNGAEVLLGTNPYELARFIARGGTHIVYANSKGKISAQGFALEALTAFNAGKPIDMGFVKVQRTPNGKRKAVLLERDGRECFYCGLPMVDEEITVEHLIALDKGGTNRLENLALAHDSCNRRVGNQSLTLKLKIRDQMRRNQEVLADVP